MTAERTHLMGTPVFEVEAQQSYTGGSTSTAKTGPAKSRYSSSVRLLTPLPPTVTRLVSLVILIAWGVVMATLLNRSYMHASTANLATDLARFGSAAAWRGVYYRGEKIGFTVTQTLPKDDGFELEEDGRLQMSLLGATTPVTIRTTAHVDRDASLRSFELTLDPGTGPTHVRGEVNGRLLTLDITTPEGSGVRAWGLGTRTEERQLAGPPVLWLTLPRRLANGGLVPGSRHRWTIFDPATLHAAPVVIDVGNREVVRSAGRPIPAFRVEMELAGLRTTSWVTDTGDVVREQSPLGLMTVRETAESARAMAVPERVRTDMIEASAVVPVTKQPIDQPRDVRRLRLRLEGVDLSSGDPRGAGQSVHGDVVEIEDARALRAGRGDPEAPRYLAAEPFIESDAPEILAEAKLAVRGVTGTRDRAERLTRYVNSILEKKPTLSLPSALEVLRTRIGDCGEHTVLYVAMARALGIPARIAVGLVSVHGVFYYHAWAEVYLAEGGDRGLWLPVDPTLNEFPADATHLRLARGGLEKRSMILSLIGKLKITVLDLELAPNTTPILVGLEPADLGALAVPLPRREPCCSCASQSPPSQR
jgi:transglutaminase-like putative cysteine protease